MAGGAPRQAATWGTLLVTLQLALMALLVLRGLPAFFGLRAPFAAWLLALLGVALGGWALSANRPGNFNIRPQPRIGGRLVTVGPYRWIRHPMYSAVLLGALACVWAAGGVVSWVAWLALCAVLGTKAVLEEHALQQVHPGYAAYRARTRRFVPGVF